MNSQPRRIPFALTAFGIPHVLGYLNTKDGSANPAPMSTGGLLDTARDMGLTGVELPVDGADVAAVERLAAEAGDLGLRIVPDHRSHLDDDLDRLAAVLRAAKRLHSPVVRLTISGVLCGDRRTIPGGWQAHLDCTADRLGRILPAAEDAGICIALENHQDLTSDDLVQLHERTGCSSALGVTLDTGNPLAVGEGTLEYAQRLGPLIRHIHLKDYTMHFAPNGYRLVRCAAGDGVVPFAEILTLVRRHGHSLLPGIEIAAQATRTIPLLEDTWWHHYPERHPALLVEALRTLWQHGRPDGESYSSAWERGENSAAVVEEEWDVLRRSVDFFRALHETESAGEHASCEAG